MSLQVARINCKRTVRQHTVISFTICIPPIIPLLHARNISQTSDLASDHDWQHCVGSSCEREGRGNDVFVPSQSGSRTSVPGAEPEVRVAALNPLLWPTPSGLWPRQPTGRPWCTRVLMATSSLLDPWQESVMSIMLCLTRSPLFARVSLCVCILGYCGGRGWWQVVHFVFVTQNRFTIILITN